MAESTKGLTDSEIADLILSDIADGLKFADSTLSTERTNALQYYYGELPRRLNKGSSGYRSLDVYDQVETARAMLMETFVGNELPIRITPGKDKIRGAVAAALSTQYVNDVLFTQNPGEEIVDQVIFDGLVARIGVVRVDWEETTSTHKRIIPGLTMDQVNMIAQDEEVTEVAIESAEEPAEGMEEAAPELWDATISVEKTEGAVKVSPVRPEDFIVNTAAKDLYEYPICHRLTKRMSVWQSEGYEEDALKKAMTDDDRMDYEEALARNDAGDGEFQNDGLSDIDPLVTLLDAYASLDINRDGKPRYHRILIAGTEILEKEEVSDHPFVDYIPIKVPHIYHGVQFTKTIIPTANAKTALTRSIIDHAMRTNNPRWTVMRGTFKSPRELLENRFGGLVNVDRPDGIQALPQPNLNPFVFTTMELLDKDLSDTTGLSRMSQGVDKDVISKQNSRGMMQDMAQASETRLRIMARRFASTFLKGLARKIYAVAVGNDAGKMSCVVDGKPVDVAPSEWPMEADIHVRLELSPKQKLERVGHIANTIASITQDPELSQVFDFSYKRRMVVEAMKLQGFYDAELAISPEPPKPSPIVEMMKQLEVQAKQQEIELQKQNSEVAMIKAETDRIKVIQGLSLDAQKLQLDQMAEQAKLRLEERKAAFNEAAATFEKMIIERKMSEDPESVKAIAAVDS